MIIIKQIKKTCRFVLQKYYPQFWFERIYKKAYGHLYNWDNPQDLVEKQRWIQFMTDISDWSRLADKYRVREYLSEKGYDKILVPLYGKWDSANEIDFSSLPDSFVLKTNHGYGEVILVKDKSKVDIDKVRADIDNYLHTPFGYKKAETHYLKIKPCIIAEELLGQDGCFASSSLVDYKFFTFHGQPKYCAVFFNRSMKTHHAQCQLYDMDWHLIEKPEGEVVEIPRPTTFSRMIKACQDLSSQFPFVRMDFYEVKGKLYFGEFTFTPAALNRKSSVFNPERLVEWGKYMDLSKCKQINKKPGGFYIFFRNIVTFHC